MAGAIISAGAAVGILIRLTDAADIQVSDRNIRLLDVAEVVGADDSSVPNIVVASLAGGGGTQEVRRTYLAQLIRRAIPRGEVSGELAGSIRIHAPETVMPGPAPSYSEEPRVRRGDKLTLSSTVGPVSIQRPVVALQNANSRQRRVFVRSSDGEVFAAPVEGGAAK